MSRLNRPSCPFEHISDPALETAQIDETSALTVKLLDKRYPAPAPVLRGVHPKSHGCLTATFTVNADLDPSLRVGLFAEPGKQYDAMIRFSNAAALVGPDIGRDGSHGSRGMAIKIFNVSGAVLSDDQGAQNQDFLMINQAAFAFANTEDYLRLDRVLDRDNDDATGFFAPLQLQTPNLPAEVKQRILAYMDAEQIDADAIQRIGQTARIVSQIVKTPVMNPFGVQYFGAAPFLFGADRVMRYSARPSAVVSPTEVPFAPADNYLRDVVTEVMSRDEPVHFDFLLQVRVGSDDMDIENASSSWDDATYPFIPVARIDIAAPQPHLTSDEHLAACERLAFTPWHSLVEHQPIGSINRLRQAVYEASASHRL